MPPTRIRIPKAIAGLLILSTLLVYLFWGAGALFESNRLPLPFGFSYCLQREGETRCGKIQSLNSEAVQALFISPRGGDLLILNSWIRSSQNRSVRAFLVGNGDPRLYVNDSRVSFVGLQDLKLRKGYNKITIRYSAPGDERPQFTFSLSGEVPFYGFVLPQRAASRVLSGWLSALDRLKLAMFVLTFLVLVFRIWRTSLSIETKPIAPLSDGIIHDLFRGFSFFLVFGPWVVYLNHALNLGVPDSLFLFAGVVASLGISLSFLFRKRRDVRRDGRSVIVYSLIVLFVLLHVYLVSGSLLPPPVQGSDLPNHLRMMQYYRDSGDVMREGIFSIYPQGIHAVIALVAGHLNLPIQESLIMVLVIVLISTYFMIYQLSREFFGRIPFLYFFIALSLSHFRFIFAGFFRWYSFPSLIAIFFFLLSLYFFLRMEFVQSSLSLASAVITYPYYAFFFIWVILFLSLHWLKEPGRTGWRKFKRPLLYFSVPVFSSLVYFYSYWRLGFPQQEEGFRAAFKINPFISMQIINALLLLGGLYVLQREGKNRRAMRFVLAAVMGFLAYYVPYSVFSVGSTYYFMKNMQYVILLSIPLEIIALQWIFRGFERKPWAKWVLFSGAVGIYILRIVNVIPF